VDTFRAHSGHSDLIEKEPLIPVDQSEISVERSTGTVSPIGTTMATVVPSLSSNNR